MNKSGHIFPDLIQFYLSDLLAIPIAGTLGLWFMRWVLNQRNFVLSPMQVLSMVLLFSCSFEMIFPFFMDRYTGDPIDIGLYFIGGLFFLRVMNK
ncbi:hypothetical protein [Pedobacter sp. KBW06]|uniref:hypothetical protein n=1 Tax=Pedobacter sp. KBW06 TaxID=2153359 RepID=UPI000F5AB465|nr:hypothetical protein [Pedobacter sp. KBW06]